MPEYIERKRVIVDACNSLELFRSEYAALEDALNKIPAADVVPVVRCKDCREYRQNPYSQEAERWCMCWSDWIPTEPYDFCNYGKRKDDYPNT